jgi:hypothetical protein
MATQVSEGVANNNVKNPPLMSQAEAEGGTDTNERLISAQRLKQAFDAWYLTQ